MQTKRPVVLSVAGFDPCGGAGVLADVKTLEQLRIHGLAVVTAYTVQTEEKCYSVNWRTVEDVIQELKILMRRYTIDVVKIGVVPNVDFLKTTIRCIKLWQKNTRIVWDPVVKSSSGLSFFDEVDLPRLAEVIQQIDLITPNYIEYQMLDAVVDLNKIKAVLVKGGHRCDLKGIDVLKQGDTETLIYPSLKEPVFEKHGSGCILSSAIASYLAWGKTIEEASRLGKKYIELYLQSSPTLIGYHHHEG